MKIDVGILGATGMVGQRFIQLLEGHKWFNIEELFASERSANKPYKKVAKWYLDSDISEDIKDIDVLPLNRDSIRNTSCDLIFSAIPSDIAREVEALFAREIPVFSNTKTYRMENDVPLIIPEVNPEHLSLVEIQREKRDWNGFIVTNPNCTTIGLVIPLKPIMDNFGLEMVNVTTLQALSGAGYSGVPSMAILDNAIPFISGEEEKVETEPLKILGSLRDGKIEFAKFEIFASCTRVMVRDGHLESVFVNTKNDFTIDELKEILSNFESEPQRLNLPTAPKRPIVVREEDDRPQPLFDRDSGNGMSVVIGRMRKNKERCVRFFCLSHNTIRGAAGASILNAELAYKKNYLK
ncbi:MAG: aspartate-semialdehyde dehydrogenase [Candidatus Altiarchaeales archaeon]|nr:MAG: aspartate-semialdehyde dehydrogenase [Candidatus Altiarchaeales archaeon]